MPQVAYPVIDVDYPQAAQARVARLVNPLRFVEFRVRIMSRHELTAEIAYYRAQRRGFVPGHEVADWVAAESELDRKGSP